MQEQLPVLIIQTSSIFHLAKKVSQQEALLSLLKTIFSEWPVKKIMILQ